MDNFKLKCKLFLPCWWIEFNQKEKKELFPCLKNSTDLSKSHKVIIKKEVEERISSYFFLETFQSSNNLIKALFMRWKLLWWGDTSRKEKLFFLGLSGNWNKTDFWVICLTKLIKHKLFEVNYSNSSWRYHSSHLLCYWDE
jgi:thiamine pyrophosphokinase